MAAIVDRGVILIEGSGGGDDTRHLQVQSGGRIELCTSRLPRLGATLTGALAIAIGSLRRRSWAALQVCSIGRWTGARR